MKGNKFSPDSRSPVQYVDDPDLAYVMRRCEVNVKPVSLTLKRPTQNQSHSL